MRKASRLLSKLPNPDKTHVTIGVPAYGHIPSLCLVSFGSFVAHSVARGYAKHIATCVGAYIDRSRNDIVRQALGNKSTHLMFVDQDMILPELALMRLLSHNKQVVGGLYFGKDDAFTPVAFELDPFKRVYDLTEQLYVQAHGWMPGEGEWEALSCTCGKPDDHMHQIGGTGMGCTLIKTSLFRKMAKEYGDQNWFSSKECGEDVHFALRCKEMGVPFYLDGYIQCGHVRDQLVTAQHYVWAKEQLDG